MDTFSRNIEVPNLMEIRPVGTELFRAGQTDRHDEAKWLFAILRTHLKTKNYDTWQQTA